MESGSFHGAHSAAPCTKDHVHRAPAVDLSCPVVTAREADPRGSGQSAALLRVARLCPLPIGVLAWRAPEPTLTVVVKATFLLGADGKSTLAAEQEPLWLDRPIAGGSFGDLDRACDFVPPKARVDVLLTGHAYAEAAMHCCRRASPSTSCVGASTPPRKSPPSRRRCSPNTCEPPPAK